MKAAVFGAGSIGSKYVANLKALGHEAVVIDTDPKRAKYRKLSAQCGRLDAAIIATPAETHLGLLRDCIAWGLPVLVEKPVGTVADLPALRALRPTKPVMVAYQLRFHPEVQRIQPLLSKSAAGILTCRCDASVWPGSAGRGDFLGEFSHELDLALACGASATVGFAHVHDHAAEIGLGAFRVVLADRDAGYRRRWEFYDEPRGSYDVQFTSADAYAADATVMYRDELAHFLRAVEGGPIAPGCTLEEGIAVLDVIAQVKGFA